MKKPIMRQHKMSRSPEWYAWANLKRRCLNSSHKDFRLYGARGIEICERWVWGDGKRSGFECFFADMGERPTIEHSLDRRNSDGNYSPRNCRWATPKEQARNRRGNKLSLARVKHIKSSNAPLKDLAALYGCSQSCISHAKTGQTWREVRP